MGDFGGLYQGQLSMCDTQLQLYKNIIMVRNGVEDIRDLAV